MGAGRDAGVGREWKLRGMQGQDENGGWEDCGKRRSSQYNKNRRTKLNGLSVMQFVKVLYGTLMILNEIVVRSYLNDLKKEEVLSCIYLCLLSQKFDIYKSTWKYFFYLERCLFFLVGLVVGIEGQILSEEHDNWV